MQQPQQPGQLSTPDGTVLDRRVLKVMNAIRDVESGGDYNAIGDNGDAKGAFQYNEKTGPGWSNLTKQYLGDANAPMNKANQNKVTYMRIKDWKDQGRDPEEIAALWNGASKDPNTGRYIYNNPEYGEKFRAALNGGQKQSGGSYQAPQAPKPFEPIKMPENLQTAPQEQLTGKEGGFLSDLGTSARDFGDNLQGAWNQNQNVGSGALQTVGAVGEGMGDVIDDSLTNIPVVGKGYEWLTEKIGQALGGASNATGVTDWFQEQPPEVQRNIEAGLNAASIVPLFKGLAIGKTGAKNIVTDVTKGSIENKAINEINLALGTQKQQRVINRANDRGLDPVQTIVRNPQYLPDVRNVEGKWVYNSKAASEAAEASISAKDRALQNLLDSTQATQAAGIPLSGVRNRVLQDVLGGKLSIANRRWENKINEIFDDIRYGYGADYISLSDLNQIKRQVREAINYDSPNPFNNPLRELDNNIQSSIMKQVEDYAKKAGIDDVAGINKEMARDITAKKVLDMLDGRVIKSGESSSLVAGAADTVTLGLSSPLIRAYRAKKGPSTATRRLHDRYRKQ